MTDTPTTRAVSPAESAPPERLFSVAPPMTPLDRVAFWFKLRVGCAVEAALADGLDKLETLPGGSKARHAIERAVFHVRDFAEWVDLKLARAI